MGPTALSLLTRRRSLLLELSTPVGAPVRRRVSVTHAAERPGLLVRSGDVLPEHGASEGDALTVIVPMSGCVWRYPTRVLQRADDTEARLLLAWPETVERVAGRRHPRVPLMLAARVREERVGARPIGTYTLDISSGGLQLVTPHALPPGALACVELALPSGAFELVAEVMWLRPVHAHPEDPMYRLGAAFRTIPAGPRTRLLSYLRRMDAGESDA